MVSVRALKWLVAVMGVLILAGTVTLVAVIVQRLGGGGAAVTTAGLGQPAGTRIAGLAAAGDHLAIWVERPDGQGLVVLFDPRRGRVAGEIRPALRGAAE
ncbi:DUF6476 family protein [Caldovatus aquaticus]|uniref:DUF6476 family protein n=1 Tax=Caldovatus aquaticus TaxID=2865671 RepID=UPI0034E1DAC3